MCGIYGYLGQEKNAPTLLEGLRRLEYRGYESAGLASSDQNSKVRCYKKSRRVDNLRWQVN